MPSESALRDRNGPGFDLIETIRWEPGTGFVRLDRHLSRLGQSARQLGFRFSEAVVRENLRAPVAGNEPLRVRLTLAPNGEVAVTTQPYSPLPAGAVWTLAIAETRLDASDPLIRHKTTRRAVYDAARAEYKREVADEVLLLNGHDQVCEGTITNIFIEDGSGRLQTPPLSCGLLPGVLRGELLDQGRAREAVLSVCDLKTAKAIFMGNSLRGLIAAHLAGEG
jgi:4-amino-4-deoxychorismate lyase